MLLWWWLLMFSFLDILSSCIYFEPALQYSSAKVIKLTLLSWTGSLKKSCSCKTLKSHLLPYFLVLSNYVIAFVFFPSQVFLCANVSLDTAYEKFKTHFRCYSFSTFFCYVLSIAPASWAIRACTSFYCHYPIMFGRWYRPCPQYLSIDANSMF